MKKVLCTALATILVLGLTVAALASNGLVTISVDPSISILVNGERFHPTDANGNEVMTFTFNGTTYAPLRAMAEAFGLEVGYNSDLKMATVDASSGNIPDGGVLVYSDEKVEISFLMCYSQETWLGMEYGIQYIIKNKTDVELTFSANTVGINGISYNVWSSESIAANSTGYANFKLTDDMPPRTAEVYRMSGKITVYDWSDYSNDDYNYDITFTDVTIQ